MFVIDSDQNPPVLGAVLQLSAGQKMTLSLTVPKTYVLQHVSITYIYADGYGGRVEAVEDKGDAVGLIAYSKAGAAVLDYTRINPQQNGFVSVQDWLGVLCASITAGSSVFMGDNNILSAAVYTQGVAVGAFLVTLQTIASCFGLDLFHISTVNGDVFKFCHPGALPVQRSFVGKIMRMIWQAEVPQCDSCVLTRIVPVKQRDSVVIAPGRGGGVQYTERQDAYLQGVWNAVPVIAPEYPSQSDTPPITLTPNELINIDNCDSWYYMSYIDRGMYKAPAFGEYVYEDEIITEDWVEPVDPTWTYRYSEAQQYTTRRKIGVYGIFPSNQAVGHYHLNEYVLTQQRDRDPVSTSNSEDYDIVNAYLSLFEGEEIYNLDHRTASYVRTLDGWDINRAHAYRTSESRTIDRPTLSDWPWLLLSRTVTSIGPTTTVDTESGRSNTYSNWEKTTINNSVELSKPLFDAGFDDTFRPVSIDPNPPSDISLDKHSETWFDATASPDVSHRFMGLGLVANISYSLQSRTEKIALKTGHEPGLLTARWQDGSRSEKHIVSDEFDTSTLNSVSAVTCTLVSSDQKSFSTADGSETGQIFTLTSDVWPDLELALACLPYVIRQQKKEETVNFSIPLAMILLPNAIDLLGNVVDVNSTTVYLTAISVDYNAEVYDYSGYVIKGDNNAQSG